MADTASVESDCKKVEDDKNVSPARSNPSANQRDKSIGYRSVDLLFSLLAILPTLFILGVCYIAMKLLNGWEESFLIRSHRVGLNGISFTKLKIRTTRFSRDNGTEKPRLENMRLGSIIRSTRLDALPQIWNVLRGDMAWIGPRAPRKMVSYSLRSFGINSRSPLKHKPGLMRIYSVAASIESYPKIAAFFDQRAKKVQGSFFLYVFTISYRGIAFLMRFISKFIAYFFNRLFLSRNRAENRRIVRVKNPLGVEFYLYNSSMEKKILHRALIPNDINYEAMSFEMPELLDDGRQVGIQWTYHGNNWNRRKKRKTIYGTGYLKRKQPDSNTQNTTYVLFYQPASARNRFLMDFYILQDSLR